MAFLLVVLIWLSVLCASLRRTGYVFGLLLSCYPLELILLATNAFFASHGALFNVMSALVLVAALLFNNRRRQENPRLFVPDGARLVYLLYGLSYCSFMWTSAPLETTDHLIRNLPYVVVFVLLGPYCLSSLRDFHAATVSLVVVGILTLSILLLLPWSGRSVLILNPATGALEAGPPLAIANLAGNVLITSLLFSFRDVRANRVWSVIKWAVAVLCIVAILRTGARGQMIALVPVLCLFYPLSTTTRHSTRRVVGILALGCLALITIALMDAYAPITHRWDRSSAFRLHTSWEERFLLSRTMLVNWYSADLLGLLFGLGAASSFHYLNIYPHNVTLEILAELGLFGFAVWLAILYSCMHSATRILRSTRELEVLRETGCVFIALLSYSLILSFKQGSMLTNIELFVLAISLMRLDYRINESTKSRSISQSTSRRYATQPKRLIYERS